METALMRRQVTPVTPPGAPQVLPPYLLLLWSAASLLGLAVSLFVAARAFVGDNRVGLVSAALFGVTWAVVMAGTAIVGFTSGKFSWRRYRAESRGFLLSGFSLVGYGIIAALLWASNGMVFFPDLDALDRRLSVAIDASGTAAATANLLASESEAEYVVVSPEQLDEMIGYLDSVNSVFEEAESVMSLRATRLDVAALRGIFEGVQLGAEGNYLLPAPAVHRLGELAEDVREPLGAVADEVENLDGFRRLATGVAPWAGLLMLVLGIFFYVVSRVASAKETDEIRRRANYMEYEAALGRVERADLAGHEPAADDLVLIGMRYDPTSGWVARDPAEFEEDLYGREPSIETIRIGPFEDRVRRLFASQDAAASVDTVKRADQVVTAVKGLVGVMVPLVLVVLI